MVLRSCVLTFSVLSYSPTMDIASYGNNRTVGCLVYTYLDDKSPFETWDGLMITWKGMVYKNCIPEAMEFYRSMKQLMKTCSSNLLSYYKT